MYGGAGVAEGQGSYIFWNQSLGTGEFNLVNNRGGGVGGFHFTNCNSDGSTNAQLAELNHQGTLSIKGNLLTYQSLSDARLKENITDMESVSERMKRLRPVRFTWREDMGNDNLEGKDDFGLIAQEVQTQFPELV